MTKDSPNWFAAACGLAYIVSLLFLPLYRCVIWKFTGVTLLGMAPSLIILLLCALAMIGSGLLLEKKLSIGVGAVSALITIIFSVLGNKVLPMEYVENVLGVEITQYVPVPMEIGMMLCILLCIVHCVLEVFFGDARKSRRPLESDAWDDSQNNYGSFDF